jgi:hypothetical protein
MSMPLFSPDEKRFIEDNLPGRSYAEMEAMLNRRFGSAKTKKQIKAFANSNKLCNGKATPEHKYTPEQIQFLKDNVSGLSYPELTKLFNRRFRLSLTKFQIWFTCKRAFFQGVFKENERYHRYTGEELQFIKNNIKGIACERALELFNKRFGLAIGKMAFKHVLHKHGYYNGLINHGKTVGAERLERKGYVFVKSPNSRRWKPKHRLIWEAANGPIPKGHVILFADGNRLNFDLDNLLLVSRNTLSIMNRGLVFPNAELTKTGKIVADIILLEKQIKRRKRK